LLQLVLLGSGLDVCQFARPRRDQRSGSKAPTENVLVDARSKACEQTVNSRYLVHQIESMSSTGSDESVESNDAYLKATGLSVPAL